MLKRHSEWITILTALARQQPDPITRVRLRRPTAGDVVAAGNLAFADILRMRTDAMLALIPRIAEPFLVRDEVAALDVMDLLALPGAIVGFLVDPQDAEALIADAAGAD